MNTTYLVGGVVLEVIGIAILVFRVHYAAWWNRVYKRRNQPENFTVVSSIMYGVMALVAGIALGLIAIFK
jgi:hypothetical protein